MAGKRSLDDEQLNIDSIFESLLNNNFEETFKELFNILKNEPKFKHLKQIGEKQFYEASSDSNIEMEHQISRINYAKIRLMVEEVQKTVETIISNKFQGHFLSVLKENVLNVILELYSQRKLVNEESSKNDMVLSQVQSSAINQNCSRKVSNDNLNDVSKRVIPLSDTENAEKILSMKNKASEDLAINNCKSFDENVCFGSCSSVHTSDLSSFDDSLVFSSDEETGLKGKRMSMEAAKDRLVELESKKLSAQKIEENKTKKHEVASKLKNHLNASSSVLQKFSPRVRKPNLKYFTDEIISPLNKTAEKFSTSTRTFEVNNSLPRKRGRPRKL